ncbi:MAG TPA: hypothetical protein PLZ36_09635 [Armatimonadota bacterium]|nr:hypothetical protein [Armatimonadota bacterium]HOS42684.1 hypothetical protein [Armatimonadota bacterium]
MLFTIVMTAALLVIVGLALREVALFARRHEGYPLRRFTLRLSTAGMLFFLFGSIFLGVRVFGLANPVGFDTYWIAFWAFVTMLTFAVLCLVLADLRTLGEETRSEAAVRWQEMARMLAAHTRETGEEPRDDA